MASSPIGTSRSGFLHGAGHNGSSDLIQELLEACFPVVWIGEACFWCLDCDTQNQKKECDLGVGGRMRKTKTLGRGVFNSAYIDLKPWHVEHGMMGFQGHLLGSYRKNDK